MPPQNNDEASHQPSTSEEDPSIKLGRFLSSPSPGEEIVITGLSGKYPDSDDVYEFRDNLFNKVDMVSGDDRRWYTHHPEIPQRTGKLKDIHLFDAGFFGIHSRQAHSMDPMVRLVLERSIECLFDAGYHPSELEGTNTGIFIGSCFSETEKTWFFDRLDYQSYAITGNERSMVANRVSYFLRTNGPSYVCDTACSSSLYALEHAYRAIRLGQCDQALVAGTNLCLHPFVSLQFFRLGVLSMDGNCKVFDAEGNGYVRSEAVSVIFLQKAKESRRVYATLLHAKTNCDGYKDSGITYPSGEMQVKLLKEFYDECQVDPSTLTFLEAHGTGTKVGDPEECQAIEEVFVKNRKTPLLVGSVKSNIGHSEPSSGLCSITKAIIALESGYIPPNINFKSPRKGMKAIEDGRMIVVTEKTKLQDNNGLIGVNSFGFGGGNCHILLKWNTKEKKSLSYDIPKIVCVSGRNKNAVDTLLDDVIENKYDPEHIRLLHEVFRKNIAGHHYRGYSISTKYNEISRSVNYIKHQMPLYIVFSELSHVDLSNFASNSVFTNTMKKIQDILATKNISAQEILLQNKTSTAFEKILSTVIFQICLIDVLKDLEIKTENTFGLFLSEILTAYWHDTLTLKETIECAYIIAKSAKDVQLFSLLHLVVENEKNLHKIVPKEVDIVSSISENSVIVAGNVDDINNYRNYLKHNNVVHSYLGSILNFKNSNFIKNKENVLNELSKVIGKPRKLNGFDSVTADHFLNSLTNISLLNKFIRGLPKNAMSLEIGNGILSNILKILPKNKIITATIRDFNSLLNGLGKLYESGHNPQVHKLYPKIEFPVSRGTPMISPKVKWNHKNKWWVSSYNNTETFEIGEMSVGIWLKDPNFLFFGGHVIDGRTLCPATGYLEFVWETLAQIKGVILSQTRVVFENCKFRRACTVPKEASKLELTIMVQRGTGNFEVIEGDEAVVTGRIYDDPSMEKINPLLPLPSEVPDNIAKRMNAKDIYKELRLRGYNYRDAFRCLTSCDNSCQVGTIKWEGNWITFIDNMLQFKILQEDTRLLYVPTSIKKLKIDAVHHILYVNTFGENPELPVYSDINTGIIKCGGIEISGLIASSIARRKYLGTPVLEKYLFVPNDCRLSTEDSMRTLTQILLENSFTYKIKVVEVRDEHTDLKFEPISTLVKAALEDQPLVQSDVIILTKESLELKNIRVEDKKLITETECMLIIGSKLLERVATLKIALGSLKEGGFVVTREPLGTKVPSNISSEIEILAAHELPNEKVFAFKKCADIKQYQTLKVSVQDTSFKWLPKLQSMIKNDSSIIIYSQNEPLNGILGLVNCMKRETGGQNTKCVFIVDSDAPVFDQNHPFYKEQLKKNLSINVYKNGKWGTYRHLLLENLDKIDVEHSFVNTLDRGDLSSLKWVEGPLTSDTYPKGDPNERFAYVYYVSLNFRDVMTASGKINVDIITRDRTAQECVQGFEFTGRYPNGKRMMGLGTHGSMATVIMTNNFTWDIPDHWTLEQAASVPVAYSTAIYALIQIARIKKGDTVLIHSGTGGVGQAAIRMALFYGCIVYTTVGTPEKRELIKNLFPVLTDKHIANSRDMSFEKHIMEQTNGRGVDIVINSLAEEKLLASVRCLAKGGRFVEIGKYDLGQNNALSLLLLKKDASFHGLMMDSIFNETAATKLKVRKLIDEALDVGAIVPLPTTVFERDDVEQAFRYMASGKHTGKIVLRIREEESERVFVPKPRLYKAIPRYFCDASKTYVVIGGLGGFGLELVDWLILRGARKLVLTSRSGVKTGYQDYRIKIWKSYGCTIHISTQNIITKEGCKEMLLEANKLGSVQSIFNLAVVLKDALLENQTEENFEISFGPKAVATQHLDELTRKLCPELRDFVVFSSLSCGRGNGGQTNYGMANSVMERICEKRRDEGFPALAIEWGAVGDVGLVAEMREEHTELEIGGTLQQRISNCLEVLDKLLKQSQAAIVSSMVVAEKRSGSGNADNIIDAVANILGVQDLKSISLHATLAEVGMDSMTAVEIKQTLEREYEVYLTAQDIKSMTFARLQQIQDEKNEDSANSVDKKDKSLYGMNMVFRIQGDPLTANTRTLKVQGKANSTCTSKVVLLPGIEGIAPSVEPLAKNLDGELVVVQFCNDNQADTVEGMAETILPEVERHLTKGQPFTIVGYSYGGTIGMEVVKRLEEKGYYGTIVNIDGAPALQKKLTTMLEVSSEDKFQTGLIMHLMSLRVSYDIIYKHVEDILKCNSLEERIILGQKVCNIKEEDNPQHIADGVISAYKRIKAMVEYNPSYRIKSKVKLIKPKFSSIELEREDCFLSDLCDDVEVGVYYGNHVTVLENLEVAEVINKVLAPETEEFKPKESIISESVGMRKDEVKGM